MIAYTAVAQDQQQILRRLLIAFITSCNSLRLCSPLNHSHLCSHLGPFSQESGERPSVLAAASIFEKISYGNKDALSAGFIIAGWDKEAGPSVYSIPLGGGMYKQPWAIAGGARERMTDCCN